MNDERIDPVTKKPYRTLQEILAKVEAHFAENPDHGTGCDCLSDLANEFYRQLPMYELGKNNFARKWLCRITHKVIR